MCIKLCCPNIKPSSPMFQVPFDHNLSSRRRSHRRQRSLCPHAASSLWNRWDYPWESHHQVWITLSTRHFISAWSDIWRSNDRKPESLSICPAFSLQSHLCLSSPQASASDETLFVSVWELHGSIEAIDPDYCKIRACKCDQVGCEHNRKLHCNLFSQRKAAVSPQWTTETKRIETRGQNQTIFTKTPSSDKTNLLKHPATLISSSWACSCYLFLLFCGF